MSATKAQPTRKDLAEAGRRKLEAFRKQKAAERAASAGAGAGAAAPPTTTAPTPTAAAPPTTTAHAAAAPSSLPVPQPPPLSAPQSPPSFASSSLLEQYRAKPPPRPPIPPTTSSTVPSAIVPPIPPAAKSGLSGGYASLADTYATSSTADVEPPPQAQPPQAQPPQAQPPQAQPPQAQHPSPADTHDAHSLDDALHNPPQQSSSTSVYNSSIHQPVSATNHTTSVHDEKPSSPPLLSRTHDTQPPDPPHASPPHTTHHTKTPSHTKSPSHTKTPSWFTLLDNPPIAESAPQPSDFQQDGGGGVHTGGATVGGVTVENSASGDGRGVRDAHESMPTRVAATPPSPTPRPGSAMAAAAEFSTLQSYIADLEKEKFELLQQLQQQHSTLHTLESEREELVIQFNSQGKQVSGLQEQITRLQQEIGGQVAVVEQMARERDAAKNAARETGLRAKALASEIVSLEERHRSTRAAELRATKEASGLRDDLASMEKRAKKIEGQRDALQHTLKDVQASNKVMQAALRRAGILIPTPTPSTHPPQPTSTTTTSATQTDDIMFPPAPPPWDLHTPMTMHTQHTAPHHPTTTTTTGEAHDSTIPTTTAPTTPSVSGRLTQLAITRTKHAVLDDLDHDSPPHPAGSTPRSKKLMEQLPPRVLDMLPRALVAGSGNRDMSLGIIQAIQSIDALLFAVEGDKRRLMDAAEIATLHATNEDLQRKLEAQTQRMELAVQQALQGGSAVVPMMPPPRAAVNGVMHDGNGVVADGGGPHAGGEHGFGAAPPPMYATNGASVDAPTPAPTPAKGVPPTPPRRGLVGWMFGRR